MQINLLIIPLQNECFMGGNTEISLSVSVCHRSICVQNTDNYTPPQKKKKKKNK